MNVPPCFCFDLPWSLSSLILLLWSEPSGYLPLCLDPPQVSLGQPMVPAQMSLGHSPPDRSFTQDPGTSEGRSCPKWGPFGCNSMPPSTSPATSSPPSPPSMSTMETSGGSVFCLNPLRRAVGPASWCGRCQFHFRRHVRQSCLEILLWWSSHPWWPTNWDCWWRMRVSNFFFKVWKEALNEKAIMTFLWNSAWLPLYVKLKFRQKKSDSSVCVSSWEKMGP